jgi:peptidoglycan/xylan/chitin deacetylase (PgdA/CDA1 family)
MKRPARIIIAIFTVALLFIAASANSSFNKRPIGIASAATSTTTPTTGNLLLNPSLEQSTTNWNKGQWGSNTAVFAYNATGHTGSHSVSVTLSKYKNGDAKWYPDPVSVTPATSYTFSDWYQSSVATEVDAVITTTTGQTSYMWLVNTPASSAWKQTKVTFNTPANASKITFYHVINKNGQLTTDDYAFGLAAPTTPVTPVIPTPTPTPTPPPIVTPPPVTPTPPTVSITSPTSSATVKATQTITSNVTDAKGIASVQYKLDGNSLGTVTTSPYSFSWDTTKVANGNHVLTAVATNTSNLTTTSASVTVNVQNPTAPTISITSPAANATVGGATQAVTAKVTDAQGIASVQYKLDGQPLGSPVTTSPYSFSWDTTSTANGPHTLTATATNIANLSTTSAPVSVNVFNQPVVPTPPAGGGTTVNTIPNPSVETPDSTGGQPQDWTADSWGTNTAAFSYLSTGHTGNRSVKVSLSNYASGSADWDYTTQNVTSGHYRYTDWYQSDVTTEIDAAVTINGTVQYYYLGTVLPSTTWAQASAEFDIPAGATAISVFHLIAGNGSLTMDDFSFGPYTPAPFTRGIVSIDFDDGWANQYTNALPLLNKYGQHGTFYIISGELTDQPDYMSKTQINGLLAAGNEVGSHTITHPDLTTLTTAQAQNEMQQSQTTLQTTFGIPVTDFAYPYGAYNANTIAIGNQLYKSQRTVDSGYNTKDNLNLSKLLVQNVFNTTTPAQVQAWVDQANQQHTWLVLVYHEVATVPSDPTDVQYDTQISDLDAELSYIKSSGIAVETTQQAINEVVPQL